MTVKGTNTGLVKDVRSMFTHLNFLAYMYFTAQNVDSIHANVGNTILTYESYCSAKSLETKIA